MQGSSNKPRFMMRNRVLPTWRRYEKDLYWKSLLKLIWNRGSSPVEYRGCQWTTRLPWNTAVFLTYYPAIEALSEWKVFAIRILNRRSWMSCGLSTLVTSRWNCPGKVMIHAGLPGRKSSEECPEGAEEERRGRPAGEIRRRGSSPLE